MPVTIPSKASNLPIKPTMWFPCFLGRRSLGRLSGVSRMHDLHEPVYKRPGTKPPCATAAKHSNSLRHTKHIPRLSGALTEPHRTFEVRRLRPHSAFIFHR